MVREAQKAGLEFDEQKLEALHCCHEDIAASAPEDHRDVPTIAIDPGSPAPTTSLHTNGTTNGTSSGPPDLTYTDDKNVLSHHSNPPSDSFNKYLHFAATRGRIHDVLQFGNGASRYSVISWNIMEYLPFRRMDLQEDGTWRAITWPLPKGETRDIPATATIHSSVIKRMLADKTYRPGNLIVGGGGRGVRQAPEDLGIGKWVVKFEDGHSVGECFVRKEPPARTKTEMEGSGDGGAQGNGIKGRKRSEGSKK